MKRENKNLMLIIIGLILLIAIVNVSKLFLNKQEELPEVKLKEKIEKEKSLAIMVTNENGNGYKEYEGNEWPKDDYYYNHSECIDNNGKKIEGGITFNEEKNTATLTTNKTIYCTLYFDKYNYMKVPLHTISVSDGQITCPDYMSSSIKKIEFVDKLPDLDELQKNENYWDISDTSQGTPSESVIAWIEPIQDDSDYNTLYIGSSTKIRIYDLFAAFSASEYISSSNPISNLESINFNNMLDTAKTHSFAQMFRGDINLKQIDGIENWDTSNVNSMAFLFNYCKSLTDLEFLSSWDVSNVIYMHYMFQHCEKLSDINGLKKWDVSKVETMSGLFNNCISLSDISALSGWNTIHVTNMDHMFREMNNLADFSQLSKWNVSNVTSMWRMFVSDSNLETIDISGWDTSKVENMESLFSLCPKIKSIDMRNATFTQITDSANYANMFYNVPTSAIIIVKNQVQKDFILNNKTNLKFTGTQDKIKLSNEV